MLEESAVSGKRAVPDKPASQRREWCPRKPPSSRGPRPDMQPAPGRAMAPVLPQAQEHPASAERPSSPGGQRDAGPEKEPESSAGPLPQAGSLPPVTLQLRTPSTDAQADVPSPTRASPTFSPSLQRSSPHTTSFRMSPWRDSSEAALTRSACARLPASSVKLGLKLEQYYSAIQRSESVSCASPARNEFLVAPVGVASKHRLFEKELVGQSREGPASGRKNLQLSRVVTSQLNLRIGRTQESAQQAGRTRSPRWVPRCEEPVSGQQPRRLPFPPAFRPGPGGPLGQVCPAPCPAAGTARLHAASPPCPPCPRGQPPPGPAGHTGVSLHLSGWPPPSLCCLPGWRSRTDPSRALPHCPSRPTCCPGQAVLCPLPWARLVKLHGYFFYFVP